MIPVVWLVIGIVAVLVLVLGVFLVWGLKKAVKLFINSVIGFFALWVTKAVLISTLVINFWSILLVAFFGIIGFVIVIIMHFLGFF